MIAAAAENNALGKDNDLIWHLPDDFKRFKKLTTGHHIIMGRKTFESFPNPLPNRIHIVITRDRAYCCPEGVVTAYSMEEALSLVKGDANPFVIGGGEIYEMALPYADTIELTRVHGVFDSDVFFPRLDDRLWKQVKREFHEKDERHNFSFTYLTYSKVYS